jgi:F-type H+-transporting ATPase subunit alpha
MNNNKSRDFSTIIEDELNNFTKNSQIESFGKVISVNDGVAVVSNFDVFYNEVIEFVDEGESSDDDWSDLYPNKKDTNILKGLVTFIGEYIKILILGDYSSIKAGQKVKKISKDGELLKIKVGKELLGRIIDPLGNPLDGKGPINSSKFNLIERDAIGVIDRKSVHEPMYTGIKMIDSLIPIGRGQRQLIIGDRFTGKTALCIDTILNQKKAHTSNSGFSENDKLYCIYVAIGKKLSDVARIVSKLESEGAMEYTTIVVASASDNASLQYLAPYAGCALGEYFRDNGQHALVIYDDLSMQAVAYRQISLLLRLPPGREAYPGDIFYLHSRLLERASKLSDKLGGGSLTALPIIETQANDVSAYIPTNVISITDGQIFLESELFNKNIMPAINIGLSVSRVGSAAQVKITKQVAGTIKLDLAQFREKEIFATFGSSDLDENTQKLLNRGNLLIEILKQDQYSPLDFAYQAIILYAASKGFLDEFYKNKPKEIKNFEKDFIDFVDSNHSTLISKIYESKALTKDIEEELKLAIKKYLELIS